MGKDSLRTAIPLLAVLAVIFTAGCVGQSQQVPLAGNGLVIKNLFITPPEDQIQSGETIDVTADIENLGGSTARNVVAELIGASWLNLNDPRVQNAVLTGQIRLTNWLEFDDDGDGRPGVTITGPDPRFNVPGQSKTVVFKVPAPLLSEGQRASFDLKIRVTYDYETSALVSVPGYSRERYNTLIQQGKLTAPAGVPLVVQQSSNVPVTVSITGPDKLIIGPFPYDEYTYQFTFNNVGTSVPVTLSPLTNRQEDGLILGTIWVQGPGVFWRRCLGIAPESLLTNPVPGLNEFFTSLNVQFGDQFSAWYQNTPWGDAWNAAGRIGLGSEESLFISVGQQPAPPQIQWPAYVLFPNAISWEIFPFLMEPIRLRRGSTVTKSCTVGIINQPLTGASTWQDRPEDRVLINAHLKYRYFIDQDAPITVTAPVIRFPIAAPQQ
jgi:hypothetical protein